MPIFFLENDSPIPDVNLSEPDGLIAVSFDISTEFILKAYKKGIFPWPSYDNLISWYSLNPRMIVYLDKVKISKSLRRVIDSAKYEVKFDTDFKSTIMNCALVNKKKYGATWINKNIIDTFCELHEMGYTHSVETYYKNELVGGLYGLRIGKYFCGESMFHTMTDASKVAFYYLVEQLQKWQFEFIDAQQPTNHLKSLGGEEINREKFTELLYYYSDIIFEPKKWNFLSK